MIDLDLKKASVRVKMNIEMIWGQETSVAKIEYSWTKSGSLDILNQSEYTRATVDCTQEPASCTTLKNFEISKTKGVERWGAKIARNCSSTSIAIYNKPNGCIEHSIFTQ